MLARRSATRAGWSPADPLVRWVTCVAESHAELGTPPSAWLPSALRLLALRLAAARGSLTAVPSASAQAAPGAGLPPHHALAAARLLQGQLPPLPPLTPAMLAASESTLVQLLESDQRPELLGRAYQAMLALGDGLIGVRKKSGSFYTPSGASDALVKRALGCQPEPRSVCDPAVGGGAFLLACYQALVSAEASLPARLSVLARLVGADTSSLALGLTELSLWLALGHAGLPIQALPVRLLQGDSLSVGLGRPIDWSGELPDIFQAGGFELVVGNPPWVAFAGRSAKPLAAEVRRTLGQRYQAWRGFPTLQSVFVELAARTLAPRGVIALLLPSPTADLSGYAQVRRVATERHRLVTPLTELSRRAFPEVAQPCFGLVLSPCAEASGSEAAWPLLERSSGATLLTPPPALGSLARFPRLPLECFLERGFRTAGEVGRTLLRRGAGPEGPFQLPLAEGKDVSAYYQRPPRLFLNPDRAVLAKWRVRLPAPAKFAAVQFVVRQTAHRPIAALHGGAAFRNSLIAGFVKPPYSAVVLVALLNSQLFHALHLALFRDARQAVFPQVKVAHLRALPAPPPGPALNAVEALGAAATSARQAGAPLPPALEQALETAVYRAFGLNAAERSAIEAFLMEQGGPRRRGHGARS